MYRLALHCDYYRPHRMWQCIEGAVTHLHMKLDCFRVAECSVSRVGVMNNYIIMHIIVPDRMFDKLSRFDTYR